MTPFPRAGSIRRCPLRELAIGERDHTDVGDYDSLGQAVRDITWAVGAALGVIPHGPAVVL
jgi:hypothetical protein